MTLIYDLVELTSVRPDTTYSIADGSLKGVVEPAQLRADGAVDTDGEFDIGDALVIDGVSYTINRIQEPSSSGRFILSDGSNRSFDPGSESNLSVVFLTVSNGSTVRHFILPNDSLGDMTLTGVRTGSLTDVGGSDASVISTANNDVRIVCFTAGTTITADGGAQVAVEDLVPGQRVLTADHVLLPVRWVGRQTVTADALAARPWLRPILIAQGALGLGRPCRDLGLSPQHRILVSSPLVPRMFGVAEVLVAAQCFAGLPGIVVQRQLQDVVLYHILLDRHAIIFANGAPCESLYLGPEAVRTIGPVVRDFLPPDGSQMLPCRPFASGPKGRSLARRWLARGARHGPEPQSHGKRSGGGVSGHLGAVAQV